MKRFTSPLFTKFDSDIKEEKFSNALNQFRWKSSIFQAEIVLIYSIME